MKNICLPVCLLLAFAASSQFYYNDLLLTQEMNERIRLFNANKVRMVSASGFDQYNTKTTDFSETQEVREGGRALKITTRNGREKTILYHRFDDKGRLSSLIDSSANATNVTDYSYDNKGRLVTIDNRIDDPSIEFKESEKHVYSYDTAGNPTVLYRILNNRDTTEVRFSLDEFGSVGEERIYKRGVGSDDPVYYYYDNKDRLSDIVRFYRNANRLLPDFMFEYDEQDRVIQRVSTLSDMRYYKGRPSLRLGYIIWRYIYNDKGLRTKEALFNKDKELTGRIEYTYSFFQ